jgi:hypothetical protein
MNFLYLDEDLAVAGSYSRRKKEEGRRQKGEGKCNKINGFSN